MMPRCLTMDFHKEAINSIKFSSFNQMAVASADGTISFWNLYWFVNWKILNLYLKKLIYLINKIYKQTLGSFNNENKTKLLR